jgi:hypothetical protein
MWLEKMENSEGAIVHPTEQYLLVLANYLLCAFKCEKLDLLPAVISKIKAIKTQNENEESDCFRISTQYELLYMLNTKNFQNALGIVNQIEKGIDHYKNIIAERQIVNFRFNIILVYFSQKDFKETLSQINQLYYLSGRDEQYNLTTSMARVIEWMCQAGTGNFDILSSSLRNLKQHFKDRQITNAFFDSIFDAFGRIIVEAGIKPASIASIKENINKSDTPQEWNQLKIITLEWIHLFAG